MKEKVSIISHFLSDGNFHLLLEKLVPTVTVPTTQPCAIEIYNLILCVQLSKSFD